MDFVGYKKSKSLVNKEKPHLELDEASIIISNSLPEWSKVQEHLLIELSFQILL